MTLHKRQKSCRKWKGIWDLQSEKVNAEVMWPGLKCVTAPLTSSSVRRPVLRKPCGRRINDMGSPLSFTKITIENFTKLKSQSNAICFPPIKWANVTFNEEVKQKMFLSRFSPIRITNTKRTSAYRTKWSFTVIKDSIDWLWARA